MLFVFGLFCEYIHLEYERIHVIYRVDQAECDVHILVVALQEHVNIYSTLRDRALLATCRYICSLIYIYIAVLGWPQTGPELWCGGEVVAGVYLSLYRYIHIYIERERLID